MPELFSFLDESGNYEFSLRGSKYWVLTSVSTTDPRQGEKEMWDLKYKLIRAGVNLDVGRFHATEDRQVVRDEVFKIIQTLQMRVDAVVVRKNKTAPSIRAVDRFYPMMVENLLKYPLHPFGLDARAFSRVLVLMDRADSRSVNREALTKSVKQSLAKHLDKVPHNVCMHESSSNHFLQVVDYVCWAIARKYEKGDSRSYDLISNFIKSEFEIFKNGHAEHY